METGFFLFLETETYTLKKKKSIVTSNQKSSKVVEESRDTHFGCRIEQSSSTFNSFSVYPSIFFFSSPHFLLFYPAQPFFVWLKPGTKYKIVCVPIISDELCGGAWSNFPTTSDFYFFFFKTQNYRFLFSLYWPKSQMFIRPTLAQYIDKHCIDCHFGNNIYVNLICAIISLFLYYLNYL